MFRVAAAFPPAMRLGFFAAALLLLGACDHSASVIVTNDTTERITVYPYGRRYAEQNWVLDPGASHRDDLLAGDGRDDSHVASIEAVDAANTLVFCHSYNYGELKRLNGQVRITRGRLDCG